MKKTSARHLPLFTVTAAIAVAAFVPADAKAASYGADLIALSHRVERYTSSLRSEFRSHYSHTRAYRHLVADANRIAQEARHIHRLAHDPFASLPHIQTDLRQIDEAAHHMHKMVDAVESGRYGHVHGRTGHLHELMRDLNRTIHGMERVVADMRHHHFRRDRHHDRRFHRDRHFDRRRF